MYIHSRRKTTCHAH